MSAATKKRQPRGRTRAARDDRPVRCDRCRTQIVWAVVEEPDGTLRLNNDGRTAHLPLNAKTSPNGHYEYVRGTVGRPVVRELDEMDRAMPAETERYFKHSDREAGDR